MTSQATDPKKAKLQKAYQALYQSHITSPDDAKAKVGELVETVRRMEQGLPAQSDTESQYRFLLGGQDSPFVQK